VTGHEQSPQERKELRRLAKQVVIVALAAELGTALLLLTGLFPYDPNGCGACSANGLPFFWTIRAAPILPNAGTPAVNLGAVASDFVFWFAISLAVIEISSIIVAPLFVRRLQSGRPHAPLAAAPAKAARPFW